MKIKSDAIRACSAEIWSRERSSMSSICSTVAAALSSAIVAWVVLAMLRKKIKSSF